MAPADLTVKPNVELHCNRLWASYISVVLLDGSTYNSSLMALTLKIDNPAWWKCNPFPVEVTPIACSFATRMHAIL